MSEIKYITTPLTEETVKDLHAGDFVRITGPIYTARDAAHKRMYEALGRGEALPFDVKGNVIYYVGPSPTKPGEVVGSAGPTTSGRMDKYTPTMIEQGMKGMIGKGFRNDAVIEACKKHHAVYFVAIGGAAAVISQSIRSEEMVPLKIWDRKRSVIMKWWTSPPSWVSTLKVTTCTNWKLPSTRNS